MRQLHTIPRAYFLTLAVAACCSAAPAAPATPADLPALRATMEREIPRLLREGNIPGISIAVIRDRKVVWSGAYGVAGPASSAPVRPDTVFQAGSLTKPVFTYMVLRLADRGVIDLDQPLWSVVPEPRLENDPRARRITARHVLSQSTGLPNWGTDTLAMGFSPGERFGYSGEGFVWLQKVVEKLTGTPGAELVRREVLAPLGMTRSSMVWQDWFAENMALAADGTAQPLPKRSDANAAASLGTTAEDYGRFLVAVLEGTGLKPETRTAMLTPATRTPARYEGTALPLRDDLFWGLGWGLQGAGGREAFWHWGDNRAWRAWVFVRTDGSAGLVYFANGYDGLSIARELGSLAVGGPQKGLDWLPYESYDDPRRLARKDIVEALQTSPQAATRRWRELRSAQPTVVDDDLAREIAGPLINEIRGADAAVILQAAAAESPGSAQLQDFLGTAYLTANDLAAARDAYRKARAIDPGTPSREVELRWIEEGLELRRQPVSLGEAEMQRFVGKYGVRHVTREGGRLLYRREDRPRSWVLIPMTADTFMAEGNGLFRIRFVADESGRVTKLVVLAPEGIQGEAPRD